MNGTLDIITSKHQMKRGEPDKMTLCLWRKPWKPWHFWGRLNSKHSEVAQPDSSFIKVDVILCWYEQFVGWWYQEISLNCRSFGRQNCKNTSVSKDGASQTPDGGSRTIYIYIYIYISVSIWFLTVIKARVDIYKKSTKNMIL